MINISYLQALSKEAQEKQQEEERKQQQKDVITATEIMEKTVSKLAEKAAKKGQTSAHIYDLELDKDYKELGFYHSDKLCGVGEVLYRLCKEAGFKPSIGSRYNGRTTVELWISWKEQEQQ